MLNLLPFAARKGLSLRMRLTLLSASVMAGVAVILTTIFLFGADRFLVRDLQNTFEFLPGEDIVISTVQGTDPDVGAITFSIKKARNRFNVWGIAGLGLVLFAGTGAAWVTAGRALKPVAELTGAIEEIGGNDLSRRVDVQDRQDEIGRLARSFNTMMDKVSVSFERQKRFSASAAHELKTPLATILVNLEVLSLDGQPSRERMEKALAVVRTNTDRMVRLVDDLFRLTAERESEMGEEVLVSEAFAEAVSDIKELTEKKQIRIFRENCQEVTLTGNRTMLCRAISNLVENAAKYNREGGTITLSAERTDESVTVRISDTGIGIPQEELSRIFEPFYRVEKSRSRTVGGAGLGLPLVKDIVETHGGKIAVESRPGEGTVFALHFPVR